MYSGPARCCFANTPPLTVWLSLSHRSGGVFERARVHAVRIASWSSGVTRKRTVVRRRSVRLIVPILASQGEGVEVLQTVGSRVFIVPSLLSERSSLDVPRIMCLEMRWLHGEAIVFSPRRSNG